MYGFGSSIMAVVYIFVIIFCIVSAILYIFLPFWVQRIKNDMTDIKRLIGNYTELQNKQLEELKRIGNTE
jgi:predicted PurR-regulated permease PerM